MSKLKQFVKTIIPGKYHLKVSLLYRKVLAIPLYGNRFECPFCGGKFRKMITYGHVPRENALCPVCFTLERHRFLWLYLKNKTNLFDASLKFLHIAPEYIFAITFEHLPNLLYVKGDIESEVADVKFDLTKIPFDAGAFDTILCSHVLEHVVDDIGAMKELRRVLKPGGWALLQSPFEAGRETTYEDLSDMTEQQRLDVFGHESHMRTYGIDYPDRLREAGFKVDVIDYLGELGEESARKYGLDLNEKIFLCTK